jgi:DNA-binding NarL/FixJ family response regulator
MIRVLLVHDHASFCQALAFMLEREADMRVVAQAGSLAAARHVLAPVDVAVVDLDLPDGHGVDLVREFRAANPQGRVLILTAARGPLQYAQAVEAGAAAVLHKSVHLSEIVDAVRRLSAGEQLLAPGEVIEMLRFVGAHRQQGRDAQGSLERLTKREHEVLQALADGANDKDIAQQLHISTETARTHMVHILHKLGVDSRLQALVFALRHGVVTILSTARSRRTPP